MVKDGKWPANMADYGPQIAIAQRDKSLMRIFGTGAILTPAVCGTLSHSKNIADGLTFREAIAVLKESGFTVNVLVEDAVLDGLPTSLKATNNPQEKEK